MNPTQLPIYEIEADLVAALKKSGRLIVQAPTGSGKSTQIPQMLVNNDLAQGQIVVLQPRRLPARMLAARVAREMGCRLGDTVGYQIRFEDRSNSRTRIKYVTEGVLLRKMLLDPALAGIGAVIFDEFHERHIHGDVTLARAAQIQRAARPDLRLIVMSATLDSGVIENYLAPCEAIRSEGRAYPVAIEHIAKAPDPKKTPIWDLAAAEIERVLPEQPEGDVLVFMPGNYEISRTIQALRHSNAARGFDVFPLHGELPPDQQDAAVERRDRRKIVVSTNVAETSLTIDGVTVVVDSGLARVARFDPYRGINTLLIEKISKASAEQRAGRAGRTAPGRCLRLWTERDHLERAERETPEIRRIDLAEIVLTLKASGFADMAAFPWFERPEALSMERAESLLRDLGALDEKTGEITELGRGLVAFPAHPRYSRMLLAATERGCVPSVALIAALTQERNLLMPRQGEHVAEQRERKIGDSAESDFVALTRAWTYAKDQDYSLDACRQVGVHSVTARQVGRARDYFLRIAESEGLNVAEDRAEPDAIAKCVLAGFSDHLACRLSMGDMRCELSRKRRGELARDSAVRRSKLLVACEVREIEGRKSDLAVILSLATAVKQEWLKELFPSDMTESRQVFFDPSTNRVVVELRQMFRDIAIERRQSGSPTESEAAEILAEEIAAGRLRINAWDQAVEQWITRLNSLAAWRTELGLPRFGEAEKKTALREFCMGAFGYKDIKSKPVLPAVMRSLTPAQRDSLDRLAPERITLKNGRSAKITYASNADPFISLPIQSLYGVEGTIRIAKDKVPVLVHVLAPNQRPVQITRDMTGFWRDHYPAIKKEYQRKYPKHEWR